MLEVKLFCTSVPEPTVFEPDQSPDAVQVVALVDVQLKVEEPPDVTLEGVAVRVTVGAGFAVTDTNVNAEAVPSGPVQVRVYVFSDVRIPVDSLPFKAFAPDQSPDAVQEVASVVVHVIVAAVPDRTVPGLTVITTVGGAALTTAVPNAKKATANTARNVNIFSFDL